MKLMNLKIRRQKDCIDDYYFNRYEADWGCPVCKEALRIISFDTRNAWNLLYDGKLTNQHIESCKKNKIRESLQIRMVNSCRNCVHGQLFDFHVIEDDHLTHQCRLISIKDNDFDAITCEYDESKICPSWGKKL